MLIFCGFGKTTAYALDADDAESYVFDKLDDVINELDLSALESFFDGNVFGGENPSQLIKDVLLGKRFDVDELFSLITATAFSGIGELAPQFASVCAVLLIFAVLEALGGEAFDKNLIGIANFAVSAVVIGIVATGVYGVFDDSRKAVEVVTGEIQAVFPVLMTLMTASGGSASVVVFQPAVALICSVMTAVTTKILFPSVILIFCFNALNCLSDKVRIGKTAELFKSVFKWVVGVFSVFFCFFVSAKGISAASFDSVSARALKYAVGNGIPFLNSLVSSGFDVVIASCVLIKNALGSVVMILILFTVLSPIVKIGVFVLFLRLLASVSEPLADIKTVKFFSGTADALGYLCTTVAISALVYFVCILLVMCALGVGV